MNTDSSARYLICVNSEKYSEVALHFVSNMAKFNNGTIIIMHVIEPADYQSIGSVADKMREEKLQGAHVLLEKLAAKAKEWFGKKPEVIVKEGLIEGEIISVIKKDQSINMLVVGTASDSSAKSKILPPLVSSLGSKLMIPMIIVPGNLSNKRIGKLVPHSN